MSMIVDFIRREPVMVATAIVMVLNVVLGFTQETQESLGRLLAETLALLTGGAIVRDNVTPMVRVITPDRSAGDRNRVR